MSRCIDDEARLVLLALTAVWEAAIRSMPEEEVTDAYPVEELEEEEYEDLADELRCEGWVYDDDGDGEEKPFTVEHLGRRRYEQIRAVLRKRFKCGNFCHLLHEHLQNTLDDEVEEGYNVRWIKLLFEPHLLLARHRDQLDDMGKEYAIAHILLEITTPDGSIWYLDGSLDQFGVEFTEETVLRRKAEYERDFKAPHDKAEPAGPENFFFPETLRLLNEPSLENYFWKIIAKRLDDLMDDLDWQSLLGEDIEDAVSDVYSQAANKFEGAWEEARTKFKSRDRKDEDPKNAAILDHNAKLTPATPKTATEKAKERRDFLKSFFKSETEVQYDSDGNMVEDEDEDEDEDMDE